MNDPMSTTPNLYALQEVISSAWMGGQRSYRDAVVALIDHQIDARSTMNRHDRSRICELVQLRDLLVNDKDLSDPAKGLKP